MAEATIVITFRPTGAGFNLDIKCENAYLIGTGKSEYIARKLRKAIHQQRYHSKPPIEKEQNVRRTSTGTAKS